jgi:hypothetical protein
LWPTEDWGCAARLEVKALDPARSQRDRRSEMSDEQRKDEETEVEGHGNRAGLTDEPSEDGEDDVEAHRFPTARLDSPTSS